MTLVLVALATARIVEWIKELVWWPMRPRTKGGLALVVAIVLCAVLEDFGVRGTVLLGLAAAGLASLLRVLWRFLSVAGDERKMRVIERYPRANRPPLA